MKIITINTTDSKNYHLAIHEYNDRNHRTNAVYDKEQFKDLKEFIEFVSKKFNVKSAREFYDWAGVIMIENGNEQ